MKKSQLVSDHVSVVPAALTKLAPPVYAVCRAPWRPATSPSTSFLVRENKASFYNIAQRSSEQIQLQRLVSTSGDLRHSFTPSQSAGSTVLASRVYVHVHHLIRVDIIIIVSIMIIIMMCQLKHTC